MTFLYGVRANRTYNYIIEDPDVSKGRIFLDNTAQNVGSLTPRFGEFWWGQDTSDQFNPTAHSDDYLTSHAPIMTNNGKWAWGPIAQYARQEYWSWPGMMDPWIASLDYETTPGRWNIKTSAGYVVVQVLGGLSTNNITTDYWFGTDMTTAPTARIVDDGDFVVMFYEDPNTGEWWGINYDNDQLAVGRIRFTATTKTWTSIRATITGRNVFYVGQLTDSSPIFIEVDGNSQAMYVYKYTSGGAAGAGSILLDSYCAPCPSTYHYQYPSNVRKDGNTRTVFYQGGWNTDPTQELRNAVFTRVVLNPTTGDLTFQPCTMIYPTGKQHVDYQRSLYYEVTWHASTKNAWYYKPHQFTINGVNYLTFLCVDRYSNGWTERAYYYRNDKRNTWVTFTIGAGNNDDQLTYHSTWEWKGSSRNFPRYYMPLNSAGTQLLIVKLDWVSTLSFDVVKGWYEHDAEEISARSIGIDSVGRVYVGATNCNTYYETNATRYDYGTGLGWVQMHTYNYSQPTSITVTPDTNNFRYAGSPISSNLNVSIRDYTGNLVARNIKLTISGANVTFTDGTQSAVVTTNASSATSVGISITGAGRPLITANLV